MAGIFERMATIVKANVNDLIDKFEDPAKIVDQTIADAKVEYAKIKKESLSVLANENMAKKELDRLNADPHVSFTIVGGSQVSLNFVEACRSTAGFDSVCGTGTAELVPAEEKRKGLAVIMNHAAECEALAAGDGREDQKALPFSENSFSDQAVEAVTVWRIAAASITGKHHD